MFKAKIVVLGPCKSGKTSISNILSNATENVGGEYRPTKGVRILEFESSYLKIHGKSINAELELWDCSGDSTYKHFWPVFLHKTDGCIFVYDPSGVNDTKELELFYDYLLSVPDMEPQNCIVFANNKSKNKRIGKKLSSKFSQITQLSLDIEDDIKKVKVHFDEYLTDLLKKMWDMRDQEEDIIH